MEEGKTNSRLTQRMGQYLLIQMFGIFLIFWLSFAERMNVVCNCSKYLGISNLSKHQTKSQHPTRTNPQTKILSKTRRSKQLQKLAVKSTAVVLLIQENGVRINLVRSCKSYFIRQNMVNCILITFYYL